MTTLDHLDASSPDMDAVALRAKGVCVTLSGQPILKNVDLDLRAGQFLALLGPNGAGKTTLIETLAGTRVPDAGEVRLHGTPLSTLSLKERAKHLALVGRESEAQLSMNVLSVVALGRLPHRTGWGLTERDNQIVTASLTKLDCAHLGTRTLFTLSDGERQRVHWARAEAQQPDILLLDEATAHLDPRHREEGFRRARAFAASGGAVLAIAHDVDLALRHATQVAVLSRGELVARGAPRAVLTPELLARVFQIDAEILTTERGPCLITYGVTT